MSTNSGSDPKTSSNQYLKPYWDAFFTDKFDEAIKIASDYFLSTDDEVQQDEALEFKAKAYLRQGDFQRANKITQDIKSYSGLAVFLEYLLKGDHEAVLIKYSDDADSQLYKSQTLLLARAYAGTELKPGQNPEEIVESVFDQLIAAGDYDRAVLASAQILELLCQEHEMGIDLIMPVVYEQLANLISLSEKAAYPSTRAKLFMLKAKLFKDRSSAEDAEILFGRDLNENGLAEVYTMYALDFGEQEYFDKAIAGFEKVGNKLGQGFLYEAIASDTLIKGNISEAITYFDKARDLLGDGGIFEKLSLDIQSVSLKAIQGNYSDIETTCREMIDSNVPKLFKGQAAQILANTILQVSGDAKEAKKYITLACELFYELKKYKQLLFAQNIYFQILQTENDLDALNMLGEEIIQLAARLGDDEMKATKYLDLAFATIRIGLEDGKFDEEKLDQASKYFKDAIVIYQEQNNLMGEADVYQSMGNMFANIGKLEEAYNSFDSAKKLYQAEKAMLQSAITDTLIGILMLDFVVINEKSYEIAHKHLEEALVYYYNERLLDLTWKNTYYLAELNRRYYRFKDSENEYAFNKAKTYYLEMLIAVEDYKKQAEAGEAFERPVAGITIEQAMKQAQEFFESVGEADTAKKFDI